ncbi:helix-turn-helix domain-containing protein [Planosporangium thailandense]|uniref:Helix-turn-helix domain-containing protein n=1 Tax=Planosporangium thailandense TaxID=765197 RepID=A0ABX0XT94_9ACTN|nr:helix-turn-helix domain-containing protein [Planosporangium thailandense]NJC69224.1 helix-turn-helix domain-containing protein [Planosporangium thailandense]
MAERKWLSVPQAAAQLGVSVPRIRQLLATGELAYEQVGRHVLVDEASVRRRAADAPAPGRPAGPRLAWAVLRAFGSDLTTGVRQVSDRQLRHRLSRVLLEPRTGEQWVQLLRRRAEPRRYWAHPGLIADLLADPAVSPGRARAAALHGLDVSPGDDAVGYVSAAELSALERRYSLEPDPHGQVELRMYRPEDASAVLEPGRPVPLAVAALDMAESDDARMRALGRHWLERAGSKLTEARR